MNNIGVSYIDYYLPSTRYSIGDLLNDPEISDINHSFKNKEDYLSFINESLGLTSILIEEVLSEVEMLEILIRKMFAKTNFMPTDIDLILLAQEQSKDQIPNMGHYLQHKFKMNRANVINILGNHCANVDVALLLSKQLIENNSYKNILIISAQKAFDLKYRFYGSYAIIGDGAGLILVNNNPELKILDGNIETNGKYALTTSEDVSLLHAKYYFSTISKLVKNSHCEKEKIKKIIIQNANPTLFEQAIFLLGMDSDKIYRENFGKFGHLQSVDIIANLFEIINDTTIQQDDSIVSFGIGSAGTFISLLFQRN